MAIGKPGAFSEHSNNSGSKGFQTSTNLIELHTNGIYQDSNAAGVVTSKAVGMRSTESLYASFFINVTKENVMMGAS